MCAEHALPRQALTLAVEKTRYEAYRAQRPYDRVESANRLVAGERERRWHATLAQVAEVAARLAAPLNRVGERTGTGKTWRAHRVACGRYQ